MGKETVIQNTGYGLIVKDSVNPEVEVYILGSCGQSGHCSLVIVLMAVDGGVSGIGEVVCYFPYGTKKEEDIPYQIQEGLDRIHKQFTKGCSFLNKEDVKKIIKRWNKLWDC